MIRPLIRRASVTAAARFSALALSVTQANAASPAYNTTIIYLTANPTPANVSCVSRDIYLAAGNYSWHQLHNDLGADGKNIWLAAGRYHMEDCLLRFSGCRRVVTVHDPCGMPVVCVIRRVGA
ncbi:hypothetical protein ACFZB2_29760 [Streptomyces bobili]|uniref:hypothetical protein n=1 Tax=Streptomyces bobili TaxID=67280 RepID=UPI0036E0763F